MNLKSPSKTLPAHRMRLLAFCAASLGVVGGIPRAAAEKSTFDQTAGVGMNHRSRLALGLLLGSIPALEKPGSDPNAQPIDNGDTESSFGASVLFEGAWLGLPSAYGNMHGIEWHTGIRTGPTDAWMGFGFPVTFLTVGKGAPGTFRLGGSFGFGLGLRQAYGYVRARAAAVIIPKFIDVEASLLWIPDGASSAWSGPGDLEDVHGRASLFYRYGASKKAVEVFLEYYERDRRGYDRNTDGTEPNGRRNDEVKGFGGGVGISLF